jgi:hypothetical protein
MASLTTTIIFAGGGFQRTVQESSITVFYRQAVNTAEIFLYFTIIPAY